MLSEISFQRYYEKKQMKNFSFQIILLQKMDQTLNQREEQSIELLVKTHHKLRALEEDNEILKLHINILEKENQKLTNNLGKSEEEKQNLFLQNEKLTRKIEQLEVQVRNQKNKNMEYQIEKINGAIQKQRQKNQTTFINTNENLPLEQEESDLKINNTNSTVIEKQNADPYLRTQFHLSLNSSKEKRHEKSPFQFRSPLIRKNISIKGNETNLIFDKNCDGKNKKFNYTQWRRENNSFTIWRNNKNIVL